LVFSIVQVHHRRWTPRYLRIGFNLQPKKMALSYLNCSWYIPVQVLQPVRRAVEYCFTSVFQTAITSTLQLWLEGLCCTPFHKVIIACVRFSLGIKSSTVQYLRYLAPMLGKYWCSCVPNWVEVGRWQLAARYSLQIVGSVVSTQPFLCHCKWSPGWVCTFIYGWHTMRTHVLSDAPLPSQSSSAHPKNAFLLSQTKNLWMSQKVWRISASIVAPLLLAYHKANDWSLRSQQNSSFFAPVHGVRTPKDHTTAFGALAGHIWGL
jgi:hypothetical protein